MKIGKLLIIMAMMVLMSVVVTAADYAPNETITIDAFYTEAGVYAEADANLTVEGPSGELRVNNQAMTQTSTGIFYYDYVIDDGNGEYKATVKFYDTNSTLLGIDSRYFDVGESMAFELGKSPSSKTQLTTMWIVLGVLIVLAITGMVMNISLLTMFSGIILLIMCVVTFPFSTIVGVINLMLGVIFLLSGGFSKSAY